MDASHLEQMMRNVFNTDHSKQYQNIIDPTSAFLQLEYKNESNEEVSCLIDCQPLKIKLSPYVVEDCYLFLNRCKIYYLIKDLKQYRPK
jgi:hypothetical protein